MGVNDRAFTCATLLLLLEAGWARPGQRLWLARRDPGVLAGASGLAPSLQGQQTAGTQFVALGNAFLMQNSHAKLSVR
jgi:hypothetical protein